MTDHVLILTVWSYEEALIQTYTLPYVRMIRKRLPSQSRILLVTLEKRNLTKDEKSEISSRLSAEGITWLHFSYRPMSVMALFRWMYVFVRLSICVLRERVSIIHCWCTPAGALGFGLAWLLNRRLVLDSYEPHAEAMVENGTWKTGSFIHRLLFWLEEKQTRRADHIVATTQGMYKYALDKYHVEIKSFHVKPACVDLELFDAQKYSSSRLREELGIAGKVVCVYAGKLGGIYLTTEFFEFVKVAQDHWGDRFRMLLLTNHDAGQLRSWAAAAGVHEGTIIVRFVAHAQVAEYLAVGHFAVTPVKPVPTKRFCTPIKDGEYWALGLPVVIPDNISDDADIIRQHDIGAVWETLDKPAYTASLIKIDRMLATAGLADKIRSVAKQYRSFAIAEDVYNRIYSRI